MEEQQGNRPPAPAGGDRPAGDRPAFGDRPPFGDRGPRGPRGPRPDGPGGDDRPGGRPRRFGGGGGGGRFYQRRKVDPFAIDNVQPDYKDVQRLRRLISDRAKIEPRRKTGASAKNQRRLSLAIKRARHMALLPFVSAGSNR
jgi:small subunit ribosomal protein S18